MCYYQTFIIRDTQGEAASQVTAVGHKPVSMTQIFQVDPEQPQRVPLLLAALVIKQGGLVAFPTETVYGLGADATSEAAVQRVFKAKLRPADNPLIIHVSGRPMLSRVASSVNTTAEKLISRFWPGPLTLVLGRGSEITPMVSAGLDTVAVRMPANRIALELIKQAGTPLGAPSANLSGRPSATCANHVAADLTGRIDVILDGGPTRIGIESTVLDLTSTPPMLLRPGWITLETLRETIGPVDHVPSEAESRKSPGTRHRHYSPRARVVLVENDYEGSNREICLRLLRDGVVGYVGHHDLRINDPRLVQIILPDRAEDYARAIYSAFRALDQQGAGVILVEGISGDREGAAVMERLRRAASEVITSEEQVKHR